MAWKSHHRSSPAPTRSSNDRYRPRGPKMLVTKLWHFRHQAAAAVACSALAACAPFVGGPFGAGDLPSARQACNQAYPPKVGNYLPHAHCVNAAIEAHALPAARYPDLVRLQEEVRTTLSEK